MFVHTHTDTHVRWEKCFFLKSIYIFYCDKRVRSKFFAPPFIFPFLQKSIRHTHLPMQAIHKQKYWQKNIDSYFLHTHTIHYKLDVFLDAICVYETEHHHLLFFYPPHAPSDAYRACMNFTTTSKVYKTGGSDTQIFLPPWTLLYTYIINCGGRIHGTHIPSMCSVFAYLYKKGLNGWSRNALPDTVCV